MDQAYRLLSAKCSYCHYLKIPRVEINRFICKLHLIHNGLILESEELETLGLRPKAKGKKVSSQENVTSSDDSEDELDPSDLMQLRANFVRKAVSEKGNPGPRNACVKKLGEAVAQKRKAIIKEFLALIKLRKICARCGG